MMHFCPRCANLLMIKDSLQGGLRFACNWCPYIYPIRRKVVHTFYPPKKPLDDVLGGEEAWKNVDSTEVACPKCSHMRAYFMQLQTRSADEPMTTFYKCAGCGFIWKD